MDYKKEIEKIGDDLADLIKDDIKSKGLVDTGRLLNSVKADISFSKNGDANIEIEAEDYFEELDRRYGIMKDVISSAKYKTLDKRMEEAYSLFIEKEIDKIIDK